MQKSYVRSLLLTVFIFALAACHEPLRQPGPSPTPVKSEPSATLAVINHPKPELVANTKALSDAGCVYESGSGWTCAGDVLTTLGCDEIWPDALLGGLTPDYPVVRCISYSGEVHFRRVGCWGGHYERYLLLKDDEFRPIGQKSEFQEVFAPIESANEALSYALAITNLYARWGSQAAGKVDYLVDTIEDTHVDETEDGYLVHLHSGFVPPCGCGVHTEWAEDVLVTRDGEVWTDKRTPVSRFEMCLD